MKKSIASYFLLLFVVSSTNVIQAQSQKNTGTVTFHSKTYHIGNKDLYSGPARFIPDGPACPPGNILDSIVVSGFNVSQALTTGTDMVSIRLSVEHSYAGDLSFTLHCPNAQTVVLDGNAHSGGAYLGIPMGGINHYNFDGANGCDSAVNLAGTGWIYGWSETYSQQGSLNTLDFIFDTLPATDMINDTNYLTPDQPFSNLIGCPFNGIWTIEIIDDWGSDNGWLFGWEIEFDSLLVTDVKNNNLNDFRISPNPFTKQCQLEIPTSVQNATLIIYDFTGEEVNRIENLNGNEFIIQRKNMMAGIYFFRLEDIDGFAVVGKLIAE
jgi:subtilisin-like proprotein convertase family protein